MRNSYFLILFLFSISVVKAQQLQELLGKAFNSSDSSAYYFKIAKKACKTNSDLGHYYFCKNAHATDFNQFDSAVVYATKAIKLLQGKDDLDALLTVYNNLNKLYNKQGKYEKAIDYSLKGLRIAEKKNSARWKIYFLTNLCIDYHDYESFEKGIYYGKKALNLLRESEKDPQKHWRTLNSIAINYDDWNKPDSALYYHKKALSSYKGLDTLKIPTSFNNIGNTLLKQKKYKEAKKWLYSGLKITQLNHQVSNAPEDTYFFYSLATLYTNLATIESELNNFTEAENLFSKAFLFATKCKSAEKLRDIYFARAKFYTKTKNYQKAVTDQQEYIKIRDSVFDVERSKTFSELEAKYQNEKKEKQILIAKASLTQKESEIKNKNIQFLILSLITVALIVISMLFYRQQKLKREQQKQEFDLNTAISKIENQNKLQEQRLQISRDLHDNIGSQLTFIISSVDNVKYAFEITNEKLESKLSGISEFAKSTIIELRDTIWAMNKSEITLEDLQSRIHNFVEKAKIATTEVDFNFTVQEDLKNTIFSSIEGMNIYRTIQEAINNSIKYAKASAIKIDIQQKNTSIHITIKDDGVGFSESEIKLGNGIENMKKRVKEIDGTFKISSNLNQGTTILIELKSNT
jgi:signal transduction histidine kinase